MRIQKEVCKIAENRKETIHREEEVMGEKRMTEKERFIKTLLCEEVEGRVPHFKLVYFLTMEKFRKVHPNHRNYEQ